MYTHIKKSLESQENVSVEKISLRRDDSWLDNSVFGTLHETLLMKNKNYELKRCGRLFAMSLIHRPCSVFQDFSQNKWSIVKNIFGLQNGQKKGDDIIAF